MEATGKLRAHLALLLTNLFFAINFTAVKYLIAEGLVFPFGLNFLRIAGSAILFWILYFFNRKQPSKIANADMPRLALCALTGIAINQLLFIKGLSLTSSIHASLLMLASPILITFIAAWLLKESLNFFKILGLCLGISGAAILISLRTPGANAPDILWGDVMVIVNAISYAFYFILVKPLMDKYSPVSVIRMVFTFGFFMVIPFCWNEFLSTPWDKYSLKDYLILIQIVLCGTFLAYLFNIYGIHKLGASIAGSYIYLQPLFAAVIAAVVLGEEISMYKLIAAACIFIGVYLARKPGYQQVEE
ncbi:MAG: EamA family transporter [Ferruginibacter sp.]|nr:EamA family transporter [Ferruginibacter sp.]